MSHNDPQSVREARENALADEVVRSFDGSGDARFRAVMSSLVRHLHSFIRDVELTSAEWDTAIEFFTRVGHITNDKRQEFILLSDVLGASMLTVSVNSPDHPAATESTVFGPFFVNGSPQIDAGGDITGNASGEPAFVSGKVLDTDGAPIPGARIEVWEADDNGFYDVQYTDERVAGRAHFYSREDGTYDFWCVRPAPYPIPHDGPVGEMLEYAGRSPMRPAHLHYMVSAPGFTTLITHIFVDGCEYLSSDAVFGVRPSLIVPFAAHTDGAAPDGRDMNGPWHSTSFHIVLATAD